MGNPDFDVIIIGSGPAGVSAAFPLLEKGLKVLLVDGGAKQSTDYLKDNFLNLRGTDEKQSQWMIGKNYHALQMQDAISPKLRIPGLSYAFEGFAQKNQVIGNNFISLGSLAVGGLSNAWGAGVARFSEKDLKLFPFQANVLTEHYTKISKRMGISGNSIDDLKEYFGVDEDAQNAIHIDIVNQDFFSRYQLHRNKLLKNGFALGRSRVAVLNEDLNGRQACSLSGNCLWGCAKGSIYSATFDIEKLKQYKNFHFSSGSIVESVINKNGILAINTVKIGSNTYAQFSAKNIILAAGTLATTRLALKYLNFKDGVRLLSSPTAAFIVWNYRKFGLPRTSGFGLGQLSYRVDYDENISGFGSTFSSIGIPITEFAKRVPLARPLSVDVLSALLSSCVVGNLFLPGHLTKANAVLNNKDYLEISGEYTDDVPLIMKHLETKIRKSFWKMGGLVLPSSFTLGLPGSDIHYAGTLPMASEPKLGECSSYGELAGATGIYVVDAACLSSLPEKSHTLTVMANAARIATYVADKLLV